MRRPPLLLPTLVATLLLGDAVPLAAQQPAPAVTTARAPSLQREIEQADSAMFAAYNAHDADALGRFFAPDLEFYHDTGGLLSWREAMAGLTETFAKDNGIRRALVGAIEVYPIRDYGAIEIGTHRFCHREDGRDLCGTFKFLHVWKRTAAGWQVTRAVSYDH